MDDSSIRASDDDREAVVSRLRDATVEGRLTNDEFEQRVGAAYEAKTTGELQAIMSDLPQASGPVVPVDTRSRGTKRRDARAAKKHDKDLASWQTKRDAQAALVNLARNYHGGLDSEFISQPGEAVFAKMTNTALIEPRRQPGHYQSHSSGVSVPLGLGIRYRSGGSRGRYVQGAEVQTAVDVGTVFATNKRVVFRGAKATRECRFDKMVGVTHDQKTGTTVISVANRQKPMVIRYGTKVAGWFTFRMDLGIAHYRGTVNALQSRLEDELSQIERSKPGAPGAAPTVTSAPSSFRPQPDVISQKPPGSGQPQPSGVAGKPPAVSPGNVASLRDSIEELDRAHVELQKVSDRLAQAADTLEAEAVQASTQGDESRAYEARSRSLALTKELAKIELQKIQVEQQRKRVSDSLIALGVKPPLRPVAVGEGTPPASQKSGAKVTDDPPALDRSLGWGLLYFAEAMTRRIEAFEPTYLRYLNENLEPTRGPITALIPYVQDELAALGAIIRRIVPLFAPATRAKAFGPGGREGDQTAILQMADGLILVYATLIEMGLRIKGTAVSPEWETANAALALLPLRPIQDIRAFCTALLRDGTAHISAWREGRPVGPFNLTLKPDLDTGPLMAELRRLFGSGNEVVPN